LARRSTEASLEITMSETPIASREAALRIALAARTLNGLDVRALVGALIESLGSPLTETKLGTLTVDDLRTILAGDFAEQGCHVGIEAETLKQAVRLLWGQGVTTATSPRSTPTLKAKCQARCAWQLPPTAARTLTVISVPANASLSIRSDRMH
jgi:hypothetical protein